MLTLRSVISFCSARSSESSLEKLFACGDSFEAVVPVSELVGVNLLLFWAAYGVSTADLLKN